MVTAKFSAAGVILFVVGQAPTSYAQCEHDRLSAPDAGNFDAFGTAMDVAGTRAIIGSRFHDRGSVPNAGAAYVFEYVSGAWQLDDQIDLNNASANDQFGGAVALEGDVALISAPYRDFGGFSNRGVVYVYEPATHIWAQTGTLSPSDPDEVHFFGTHIDLSGNRAIVSSRNAVPSTAWVFENNGGVWQEIAVLEIPATTKPVEAVAIHGSTAMIGVPAYEDSLNDGGAVFVFEEVAGIWSQVAILRLDTSLNYGLFGNSLALDGDRALIGCPQRFGGTGPVPGTAIIYERNQGVWSLAVELSASTASGDDRFGWSVALEGENAVVGDPYGNSFFLDGGEAYLFHKFGAVWTEIAIVVPPNTGVYQFFGQVVAVGDGVAAIARPGYDGGGLDFGEVSIISLGASSNRCESIANSTGVAATLSHQGSVSVSTNNLRLVASDLPVNQFGIFFYGSSPTQLPFGDGYRCIGGQIFRFPPQSTQAGGVTRLMDLDQPPAEDGRILPGQSWHFQFWFRDPAAGGAGWNLTDALEILFCL